MADMVTLTGEFQDAAGTPETGSILFSLAEAATDGLTVFTESVVRVTLDPAGQFEVELEATDDLTVSGNTYRVEERFNGRLARIYWIELPGDTNPANIADLTAWSRPPFVVVDPTLAASNVGLTAHVLDETNVHGIPNTDNLVAGVGFNVKDYGAVGDGVTDDTAAIQDCIAATRGTDVAGNGVGGARVVFPPGDYLITDAIELVRFAGTIEGMGLGNTPNYAGNPGNASVLLWGGDDATPMLYLRDYRDVTVTGLRFEGADGTKPTYAIESVWQTGDGAGTAATLTVEKCHFGRYAWTSQGIHKGDLAVGIGFTGDNGNNDEFRIVDCTFSYCDTGVYIPNSQSIWGVLEHVGITNAAVAGVESAAGFNAYNLAFNECAIDIDSTSSGQINVYGWNSEQSEQFFRADSLSTLRVYGGILRCQSPMTTSSYMLDHTLATDGAGIGLYGVTINADSLGAYPRIRVTADGGGGNTEGQAGFFTMIDCGQDWELTDFAYLTSTNSDALKVTIDSGVKIRRLLTNTEDLDDSGPGYRVDGFLEAVEIDEPAAPGANTGRIYFADNGSGTTKAYFKGSSGSAAEIALVGGAAWNNYVPTIGGTGWDIGNATTQGHYIQIGNTIHYSALIQWGNTSTFGSSALTIALPVEASGAYRFENHTARGLDQGTGFFQMAAIQQATTEVTLFGLGASGQLAACISTVPFTWVATDQIYVAGTYEAAA